MELILLNLALSNISSFVAAYMVLTRKYVRARLIAYIVIGASIWSYGSAMEMYYVTAEPKLFWANVQFLGMALTNILPLFIAHFFDKQEWLTKRNVSLALAVPALFLGLVATNGLHGAVLKNVSINHMELNYPLIKTYGWAFYGFIIYTYSFIGASLVFGVKNAKAYSEENWKKLVVLMGFMTLPVLSNINFIYFSKGVVLDYTAPLFNAIAICFALFTPSDMRVGSLFPLEYASIIGSMKDIVIITNTADRISYVNPAAKKEISAAFIIDKDDIVGKKISRLISEISFDTPENEMEYNGTRYDISTFNLPDWRGKPKSTCYILRNISDRVKLEKKLETLHLYATKISKAQSMDEIGNITSNALSNSLGFDSGVLCTIDDYEVSYVKLWGITTEQFQTFIERDLTIENMVGITEANIYNSTDDFLMEVGFGLSGKFKDKTMAHIPIIVDGQVKGSLALFQNNIRNFTESDLNMLEIFGGHIASSIFSFRQNEALKEAQAEEIKQILEGAGRVSSMVRHDLRGPLQTIRNAAHIVETRPENISKMAPIINKSVEYIVKILEDLQYQDQPSHYEKAKLNMNALIEQVLTQLIVPNNITIQQNLCEAPADHMLDKIKIQRMLDNLFRNAFEAMDQGGNLIISTRKSMNGTEISVKDTGVGIKDTRKLFKPFNTTKLNGMGLGLVSVKQTVEKHGGSIEVKSEQGVGTEFIIRIPEDTGHMGMSETRLNSIITT
jgi:signal transduction histidine kinase/PAS domain-containing protein